MEKTMKYFNVKNFTPKKKHTSTKEKNIQKKNSKTISPLHANKNCDAFEFIFF